MIIGKLVLTTAVAASSILLFLIAGVSVGDVKRRPISTPDTHVHTHPLISTATLTAKPLLSIKDNFIRHLEPRSAGKLGK